MEDFKEIVKRRALDRLNPWVSFLRYIPKDDSHFTNRLAFYLAGGGLRRNFRDLDIYPIKSGKNVQWMYNEFRKNNLQDKGYEVVSKTANALTIRKNDIPHTLQYCDYKKVSLFELVNSFDFTHCQIGVQIGISEHDTLKVEEVYWTENFVTSQLTETTEFTDTNYPLSSLIRLSKYKERGLFCGNAHILETIKILNAIMSRGVEDYSDFKSQLDAVDLGLLPEDFSQFQSDEGQEVLNDLFNHLRKR